MEAAELDHVILDRDLPSHVQLGRADVEVEFLDTQRELRVDACGGCAAGGAAFGDDAADGGRGEQVARLDEVVGMPLILKFNGQLTTIIFNLWAFEWQILIF